MSRLYELAFSACALAACGCESRSPPDSAGSSGAPRSSALPVAPTSEPPAASAGPALPGDPTAALPVAMPASLDPVALTMLNARAPRGPILRAPSGCLVRVLVTDAGQRPRHVAEPTPCPEPMEDRAWDRCRLGMLWRDPQGCLCEDVGAEPPRPPVRVPCPGE